MTKLDLARHLQDRGERGHEPQQIQNAGRHAQLKRCKCKSPKRDKLALRDKNDARCGKHENRCQRKQCVDSSRQDTVLNEEEHDFFAHGRTLPESNLS